MALCTRTQTDRVCTVEHHGSTRTADVESQVSRVLSAGQQRRDATLASLSPLTGRDVTHGAPSSRTPDGTHPQSIEIPSTHNFNDLKDVLWPICDVTPPEIEGECMVDCSDLCLGRERDEMAGVVWESKCQLS